MEGSAGSPEQVVLQEIEQLEAQVEEIRQPLAQMKETAGLPFRTARQRPR